MSLLKTAPQFSLHIFLELALFIVITIGPAWAVPRSTIHSSSGAVEKSKATVDTFSDLTKGISLCNEGKYPESLACLRQYVANFPKDPQGQFWLGTVYLDTDNFVPAESAFRKAITLFPANTDIPEVHVNLGNALLGLGKIDESIPEFDRAIRINPKEPRAHYNLARALLEKHNPVFASVALNELKTSEQLGLKLRRLPILKAQANIEMGLLPEAKEIFSSLLSTYPDDAAHGSDRKVLQSAIDSLDREIAVRNREVPPTPPEKRHYELKPGTRYVIIRVNEDKHLITIANEDKQDPDGGKQDGRNDGIIEMPEANLSEQVKAKGEVYRLD